MTKLLELPYAMQVSLQNEPYQMPRDEMRLNYKYSKDGVWPDYQLMTTIERTRDISQGIDLYFVRLIRLKNDNQKNPVIGYLYFSYDATEKKSAIYGVHTRSFFRNRGISNYLISRWIEICLSNNVENLYTISKQRKPILIYSLKKISFELEDTSLYNQGHDVIICKDRASGEKVLFFENKEEGELFAISTINRETPHIIIPTMGDKYEPLATMLLEHPYFATNLDIASKTSKETIEAFPDIIRKK